MQMGLSSLICEYEEGIRVGCVSMESELIGKAVILLFYVKEETGLFVSRCLRNSLFLTIEVNK